MNGIELYYPKAESIVPDTREALRYIGVSPNAPDVQLLSAVENVKSEIVHEAKYAACYSVEDCV